MGYHDQRAIFVGLLAQGVQFSDGIVECLFGEVACPIGGVQDLIIEDREVEGEPEPDLSLALNATNCSRIAGQILRPYTSQLEWRVNSIPCKG